MEVRKVLECYKYTLAPSLRGTLKHSSQELKYKKCLTYVKPTLTNFGVFSYGLITPLVEALLDT